MRATSTVALALSAALITALPATAADDCKVKGWTEGGQGGRPIYECPN
jgi:hypothetical protein